MINHYTDSWELYKMHTESFSDDFDYYKSFCKGYRTLEIFSGYGRLTNFLVSEGIDVQSVELEPKFAQWINLPKLKNHITDVLKFNSSHQYERIIAAYNSFCLFLNNNDILNFFNKIDELLLVGGYASLSYYPITAWKKSPPDLILFKNLKIQYSSSFDFSHIDKNIATWIDEYKGDNINFKYEYPTKIYKDENDIKKYLVDTDLELVNIIHNYNKDMQDSGWVEYVFIKNK